MSNLLIPHHVPWKYAHRDVLLLVIYPVEIIRDVPKDMNLFVALVFVREEKSKNPM